MDGKTVQGPEKGPKFMLQVSVAKPVDKDRKRAYSDSQDKSVSKSGSWTKSSKDSQTHDYSDGRKSKAPRLQYSTEEPVVADPYEAAVVSLPSAVTERLLRIFRLGIATRYDIDIQGITSLKELPESAAIAVLDQFMLSGADGRNKGKYFTGLLARHRDRLELNRSTLPPPRRTRDYLSRGSELPSLPVRAHMPAFDPSISRQSAGILSAKYDGYTASPGSFPYSPSILDDPHVPRTGLGKLGETGSSYRPRVPSVGYGSGVRSDAHLAVRSERSGERPQVKFDPFTGKPYKFDPFTGEPIQPETPPRGFGSLF
eukprot:TRINITY_DN1572_c0_g2_i1.p1 TRINITY_DN1572_c0_g2~~TRINITY_DN1572_c0_g2_i1.p1  ORF type:complete len:314 (+),score=43.06 TRINITY_DN1572_c0_g2_i1:651-1592(+)